MLQTTELGRLELRIFIFKSHGGVDYQDDMRNSRRSKIWTNIGNVGWYPDAKEYMLEHSSDLLAGQSLSFSTYLRVASKLRSTITKSLNPTR